MQFYKDSDNNVYDYFEEGLVEITQEEWQAIINTRLEKFRLIDEYKAFLAATDYKDLPNYVPKEGEDLAAVIADRNAKREFIRASENLGE